MSDEKLNQALNFHQKGQLQQAKNIYENILAENPNHADSLHLLGMIFFQEKNISKAIEFVKKAILINPNTPVFFNNLGNILSSINQNEKAKVSYEKALQINPHYQQAKANLARIYTKLSDLEKAIQLYNELISHYPEWIPPYIGISTIFRKQKNWNKAQKVLDKALQINPIHLETLNHLGLTLKSAGNIKKSNQYFEAYLKVRPDDLTIRFLKDLSLPVLYETEDEIINTRKNYEKNLKELVTKVVLETHQQKNQALEILKSNSNFLLAYQAQNDVEIQKIYGNFVSYVMQTCYPQWASPLPKNKKSGKIKIGYVSSYFYRHTVGRLMLGWLKDADKNDFEIYSYHIGNKCDDITESYRQVSDHFHYIPENLEAVCEKIFSNNLDILIYTDIGMNPQPLMMAGLKLAPIQCKAWGHPTTTGLPTMDYYLTSDLMEIKDGQKNYSEKLIRLPNLALNLEKIPDYQTTKKRSDFGLDKSQIIYFCCQSLFKYLPQYDQVFLEISKNVKDAYFCFISHTSDFVNQQFIQRLNQFIPDKFKLLNRLGHEDFMAMMQLSDVYLDSIDWNGGITTVEAISAGLPIVTLPGQLMRGRHTLGYLTQVLVTECIAKDLDDYVKIASKLGNDLEFRKKISTLQKQNADKLFGDKEMVNGLQNFYKQIAT